MHLTAWVGNKFPGCNNGSLLGNQSILLIPQIKTEYTIIFSMNAGKAFNYIQQTFLIKKKQKTKNRNRRHKHNEDCFPETKSKFCLNDKTLKAF